MGTRIAAILFRGLAAVLLPASTGLAAAPESGWVISNFQADINVRPDGQLDVTETVTAEFGIHRHGIYREIPIRYAVGHHLYSLRFKFLGATDGDGSARPTDVSYQNNMVKLRIGDPDRLITGRQVYRISYRVGRALLWQDDRCVLRWNATGHEWAVPIHTATVRIVLPKATSAGEVRASAWAGPLGIIGREMPFSIDGQSLILTTRGPFAPGQGLTAEVFMPADIIAKPGLLEPAWWWLADNFVYGVPLLVIGLCTVAWLRRGRDEAGRGSIAVQYAPPDGLTVAEIGTLMDETLNTHDISATVIDLAVRGYISIREVQSNALVFTDTDHELHRLKGPQGLKGHELSIYNTLFSGRDVVMLSDLRQKFYRVIPTVRSAIYKSLTSQGYFAGRPDAVRTNFLAIGLLSAGVLLAAAAGVQKLMIGRIFHVPLIISAAVAAAAILLTSRFMPRKTRKGRLAWENALGLEEYIRRAEADEINAADRRGMFERLLPYALIFGLSARWAKAFEGIYQTPPQWYQAADIENRSTAGLRRSLDRSMQSMNSTLTSTPRGSGGWSSGGGGGGFGGGGGGSW